LKNGCLARITFPVERKTAQKGPGRKLRDLYIKKKGGKRNAVWRKKRPQQGHTISRDHFGQSEKPIWGPKK